MRRLLALYAVGFVLVVGPSYLTSLRIVGATPMTVLQETVEPQAHGRVSGFVTAIVTPIGTGVFGPLADRFTVGSVLVASGVAMLVVVCAGRRGAVGASCHGRRPRASPGVRLGRRASRAAGGSGSHVRGGA